MLFSYDAKNISIFAWNKKNDENIKILAKDLVANIKLLCFVYTVEKDNFYNKIKKKYIDNFKKIFKYFENAYLYKGIFSDRSSNYYNYSINFDNNYRFFFTNNLCESINRTLKI